MSSNPKMHVLSAAPNNAKRPGAIQNATLKEEFIARATRLDATGFPEEGAVAVCWSADVHGISSTDEEIKAAIRKKAVEWNEPRTEAKIKREVKALREICTTLKKGDIIALKAGITIIAFVQLTSDYQFCPEQKWGWHTWTYKLVRKATPADQPSNYRGLIKTFHRNFLKSGP